MTAFLFFFFLFSEKMKRSFDTIQLDDEDDEGKKLFENLPFQIYSILGGY